MKEAIQNYKKALEINPEMPTAMYQLAWIYATNSNDSDRNDKEAIRISKKLCEISKFNDPLSMDVLAAAYANAGRYKEAVEVAEKAYELAEKYQIKCLSNNIKERLELYRRGQPYRQSSTK
jgi:tetratricopeptide (TPR) repeat protein